MMNILSIILFSLPPVILYANTVKRGPLINIHAQEAGDTKILPNLTPRAFLRELQHRVNVRNNPVDAVSIPFIITGEYEPNERKLIFDAMDAIAENTCIQFNPRKNEKDYVNIRNQVGEGCFSSIGMEGGEQSLDLEASFLGSCMSYNIIIHELLHTVGLDHEHSRHDRDNYVKVHLENVREGRKSQFKKVSFIPDYDIPYDYTSIMHYDKLAFSRNGNITLETLDSSYQDIIGTAKHPSPNDYLKVCAMYHCGICMGKKTNTEIFTPSLSSLPELSLPLPVYGTQSDRIETQCDDVDSMACRWAAVEGLLRCNLNWQRESCCATCEAQKNFFNQFSGFINYFK